MQVFCAYKADPESAEVKPGSFELAEVRVPVIAQEYKVELAVDSRDGWGCVSVRWGGDTLITRKRALMPTATRWRGSEGSILETSSPSSG